MTSGEIYSGVPQMVNVFDPTGTFLQKPRSAIKRYPFESRRRFSGCCDGKGSVNVVLKQD